jgi:hypothetical protein
LVKANRSGEWKRVFMSTLVVSRIAFVLIAWCLLFARQQPIPPASQSKVSEAYRMTDTPSIVVREGLPTTGELRLYLQNTAALQGIHGDLY